MLAAEDAAGVLAGLGGVQTVSGTLFDRSDASATGWT